MPDPVPNAEIEDVLSSIRRLVSGEISPARGEVPDARASGKQSDQPSETAVDPQDDDSVVRNTVAPEPAAAEGPEEITSPPPVTGALLLTPADRVTDDPQEEQRPAENERVAPAGPVGSDSDLLETAPADAPDSIPPAPSSTAAGPVTEKEPDGSTSRLTALRHLWASDAEDEAHSPELSDAAGPASDAQPGKDSSPSEEEAPFAHVSGDALQEAGETQSTGRIAKLPGLRDRLSHVDDANAPLSDGPAFPAPKGGDDRAGPEVVGKEPIGPWPANTPIQESTPEEARPHPRRAGFAFGVAADGNGLSFRSNSESGPTPAAKPNGKVHHACDASAAPAISRCEQHGSTDKSEPNPATHQRDDVEGRQCPVEVDREDVAENLFRAGDMDEAALKELVGKLVHEELQGALGERITRNVRKLVRREIQRTLASRDID